MVMLDSTAGNRLMWANKNPPHVVFMDKEPRLKISPDIIADFRWCPFRGGVFDCVLFDPPHYINAPPWHLDPTSYNPVKGVTPFYGNFTSKGEMLSHIHKAQKEFQRLTNRLCFKWSEVRISLWKIIPFFRDWEILQTKNFKADLNFKKGTGYYWVTMILRSSLSMVRENEH